MNRNKKINEIIKEICIEEDIKADPFYSENNIEHLETIVDDIKNGRARINWGWWVDEE